MRSRISRAALLVKVTARISLAAGAAHREQMGDAGGQHAGLADAGAGEHQHRPVERLDRAALLGIEPVEIGAAPGAPGALGRGSDALGVEAAGRRTWRA